ncbi:MAG TPA: CotH kinase family protein [Solirubrobacterales bacterium]|nr:CotH kinase family protein [Solirubrobacterales bacterium]
MFRRSWGKLTLPSARAVAALLIAAPRASAAGEPDTGASNAFNPAEVSVRIVATILAALVLAAPAAAAPIADEAAVVYDPAAVATVDLTLSPEAIAALEAEPSEYVKGTFAMATTSGGPAGVETTLTPTPHPVEVRLKGSGSFRPITGKAAFKLKFKKVDAFLGLRKMTLNNMVQDESMVHEALTYRTFGALDVPAPRSGYAYLRLNGEDVGLYADVETLDDIALEKRFGTFEDPPQHLYEGESGDDVREGEAGSFEADEGDEEERADLEALIEAVNGSAEVPFSERVEAVADLGEMTRMWAAERYIAHWDGYAGHVEPGLRPNNYYLFSDAAGRFQMLPWGTDQTWDLNLEIPHRIVGFDSEGGLMFDECLADEACFRLYWEALGEVTDAVEAMQASAFLSETAAMLAPWQAKEREDGRATASEAQVTAQLDESAAFIANRPAEAREWLAANEPPAEEPEEKPEEPKHDNPTRPEEPILTSPVGPPAAPLRLGRVTRRGRSLLVHLGFAEAGEVRLRATMKRHGHAVTACKADVKIPAPTRDVIVCPLTPRALERLNGGATRLRVQATFTTATGNRVALERPIRLPAP